MTLSHYLRQLGLACLETSQDLRLLPTLLGILAVAPRIIVQLRRGDQRRIAA